MNDYFECDCGARYRSSAQVIECADRRHGAPMPRTDTDRLDALEKAPFVLLKLYQYSREQPWHASWETPDGSIAVSKGPTLRAAIDSYLDAQKKEGGG